MILVDSRTGSKELLPYFLKGQAALTTLPFGDFSFIGNGPEGMPFNIGIERKQVREIAGTMSDGRLVGHQIPGLLATYQVVYLVVEGRWRSNPANGILQTTKHGSWQDVENGQVRFMADAVRKFLSTLENMAGLRLRHTEDKAGTAAEVLSLYSWWTGKEWDEHRAHMALQYPPIDAVMFRKPSVLQYMAACLPGVGWKRSQAVAHHFPSVVEMVMAGVDEWCKVEGIGKGTARKVVDTIQYHKEVGK